jgi:hypothetical protein
LHQETSNTPLPFANPSSFIYTTEKLVTVPENRTGFRTTLTEMMFPSIALAMNDDTSFNDIYRSVTSMQTLLSNPWRYVVSMTIDHGDFGIGVVPSPHQ